MISDARQIEPEAELRGEIAIVGGGAAGITLAIELAKHFSDVLVLESGGLEYEQDTQDLYVGPILGHSKTDIGSTRLRLLGGTTNHWEGQCAPFDEVDFERIAGKPYSGWPFLIDALLPFYERAYAYCELGAYQKNSVVLARSQSMVKQIVDSPELALTEFRYSPPTRFGIRFRTDLETSNRIKVILHANLTNMSVFDSGRAVSSLHIQTLTGKKFKVTAAAYILCCGGIENPRILLNCTDIFPNGIGNEHDLVGRFFMDHLGAEAGVIVPGDQTANFEAFTFRYDGVARVRPALKNSDETVRRIDRSGSSIILDPVFEMNDEYLQASNSPGYAAFQQLVRNAARGHFPRSLAETECTALQNTGSIATVLYHRTVAALGKPPALKAIRVHLEGEQSPNPDSRVVLVRETDALGMRRVGLNWQISAEDRENLYQTTLALARGIGAAGFGRMLAHIAPDTDNSFIFTKWHHMGTTRMHENRLQGVVDLNCKVHGVENLFIAGSSVFPTGSRVNPTLTIVALALRLGDHLKRTLTP